MIDYFKKGLEHGRDRVAVLDDQNSFTYRELDGMAERIGAALAELRTHESDSLRVAVYSPNDARAFVCMAGIFYAGDAWIPVNARNAMEGNVSLLKLSRPEVLFYHSAFEAEIVGLRRQVPTLRQVVCIDQEGPDGIPSLGEFTGGAKRKAPDPIDDPDTIVALFPTGGTTGLSKCAVWTQRLWQVMVSEFWQLQGSDRPPVHLVAGPMTHAAGVLALMCMPKGATNVLLAKAEPAAIIAAIETHSVTHVYLPPTLLYMMLAHPNVVDHDYSSLRYFLLAAAPVAPEKFKEAARIFGPVMCQSFGQAEAPMFLTFMSSHDLLGDDNPEGRRFASCGRPSMHVRLEIMDDDGRILETGQRGEIVARGGLVFDGYYRDPAATAAVSAHGWHHTGDVGFRDGDGFFYIVDRKKDMIVTGGFNVYSAEVEQVLLAHPAVRDCAVVGVPDDKWGEAVKAVVEVKPGQAVTSEELIADVRDRLGGVHAPKSVEFWDELPRSGNGKIVKGEIRARYWRGQDRAI